MKLSVARIETRLEANNRRSHNRYGIKIQLQYRRWAPQQHATWLAGSTLDMSANGLLIDIPSRLPVGAKLQLVMNWPGLYHGKPMVRLFVTGVVVRVDRRGTALRIIDHQFRDFFRPDMPLRRPETSMFLAAAPRRQQRESRLARAIA
jgi:hypothetical protein